MTDTHVHILFIVGIALERSSGVSIQLKAAMAVEVVDYLLRSNWSVEVRMSVYGHDSSIVPSHTLLLLRVPSCHHITKQSSNLKVQIMMQTFLLFYTVCFVT